jgi:hypothetical protein
MIQIWLKTPVETFTNFVNRLIDRECLEVHRRLKLFAPIRDVKRLRCKYQIKEKWNFKWEDRALDVFSGSFGRWSFLYDLHMLVNDDKSGVCEDHLPQTSKQLTVIVSTVNASSCITTKENLNFIVPILQGVSVCLICNLSSCGCLMS